MCIIITWKRNSTKTSTIFSKTGKSKHF